MWVDQLLRTHLGLEESRCVTAHHGGKRRSDT